MMIRVIVSTLCRLSGNVMYFEQPQLAQWDDAKNVWKMDALTEPQFNEGV